MKILFQINKNLNNSKNKKFQKIINKQKTI